MEHSNFKYTSSSVKTLNSHVNIEPYSNTIIKIRYTVPSHHDNETRQNTTETQPQWYGYQLAKQQLWQEQRVFAHRQCVSFSSSTSSTDKSIADDDNSTTDNYNSTIAVNSDDEGEESTPSRPTWQFSSLAKQFLQSEQECFANTFTKVKVSVQESEETEDEKSEWRHVDLARHWEQLEQRAFAGSFGRR